MMAVSSASAFRIMRHETRITAFLSRASAIRREQWTKLDRGLEGRGQRSRESGSGRFRCRLAGAETMAHALKWLRAFSRTSPGALMHGQARTGPPGARRFVKLHVSPRGEGKSVRVTRHETRNTNHGLLIACFGHQAVSNAG